MTQEINTYRISICGSVDDGKSTLLGRLMYEMGNYTQDKLSEVKTISARNNKDGLDYSLFTDGLMAEREQGITIDVAHLYMTFENKRIIWADAPGHEQYTRNMITAASTSNASLLLSDVSRPVTLQFQRHFEILQMLDVQHILVAVNKMDLVDFNPRYYEDRRREILNLVGKNYTGTIDFIPVSATTGYNVTEVSEDGQSDISVLSWIANLKEVQKECTTFLQVQMVDHEGQDKRNYHVKIYDGEVHENMELYTINGQKCTVTEVFNLDGESARAKKGECATIRISEDVDLSRGTDLLSGTNFKAMKKLPVKVFNLGWNKPLRTKKRYILQRGLKQVKAMLELPVGAEIGNNAFSEGFIKLAEEVPLTSDMTPVSRSFILIDEQDNATCGAGIVPASL